MHCRSSLHEGEEDPQQNVRHVKWVVLAGFQFMPVGGQLVEDQEEERVLVGVVIHGERSQGGSGGARGPQACCLRDHGLWARCLRALPLVLRECRELVLLQRTGTWGLRLGGDAYRGVGEGDTRRVLAGRLAALLSFGDAVGVGAAFGASAVVGGVLPVAVAAGRLALVPVLAGAG